MSQETIVSLEKQQSVLKRKASELSQHVHSASSIEFLRLRQAQLANHKEQFSVFHKGLKATFKKGTIDRKLYEKEVERCWIKRAKLSAEDLTISRERARLIEELDTEQERHEPDWPAVYADLLTNLFNQRNDLQAGRCRMCMIIASGSKHFLHDTNLKTQRMRACYGAPYCDHSIRPNRLPSPISFHPQLGTQMQDIFLVSQTTAMSLFGTGEMG